MTPFQQLQQDFGLNTKTLVGLQVDQFIVQPVIDKLNRMGFECCGTRQFIENKSATLLVAYKDNTWDTYAHIADTHIPINQVQQWLEEDFIILTDENDHMELEPIEEKTMQFPMMIEISEETSRNVAKFLNNLGYQPLNDHEEEILKIGTHGYIYIRGNTYDHWFCEDSTQSHYTANHNKATQMLDCYHHSELREFLEENAPNKSSPNPSISTSDLWEYPTPSKGETMSTKPSILSRIFGIGKGLSSLAGLFFLAMWATKGQPTNLLPNVSWGEEWSVVSDSIITEEGEIVQFDVQNQWGEARTMVIETSDEGHLAIQLNPEYGTAADTFQRLAQRHLGFVKQVQENPRLAGREIPGPTEWDDYMLPAIWW